MATPLKPTDGEEYLKAFADAVRNRRADDFYDKLQDVLKPDQLEWLGIKEPEASQVLVPQKYDEKLENNLLIAAFHYTSPSIGRWHRVVLEPTNKGILDLKPLELAQHDEAYNKAPMDINIPVSKKVNLPFWIKLGDAPGPTDLAPMVSLSSDERTQLKQLFDDFDNKQFYDLILGLDTFTRHEKASASLSKLKHRLVAIRDLVFPDAPAGTAYDRDALAWRSFVFSFFLAIRLTEPVWVLVLPLWEEGLGILPDCVEASLPPTTYVAALNNPKSDFIETAKNVLLPIVRMLTNIELRAVEGFGSQSVVVLENTVRLCTMIDERVQRDVNLYRKRISKILEGKFGVTEDAISDPKAEKWLLDALKMTGADPPDAHTTRST